MLKGRHERLLTFGGAYSNHIAAMASAGKQFKFQTIGVIRGEEHLPLNPTLSLARKSGMHLYYLDRTTYRKKMDSEVLKSLQRAFGSFYLVPEGGTNQGGHHWSKGNNSGNHHSAEWDSRLYLCKLWYGWHFIRDN